MSDDRLQEIRARLDAATADTHCAAYVAATTAPDDLCPTCTMHAHAHADIAWLLDEVERLRRDDSVVQGVTKWERPDAE